MEKTITIKYCAPCHFGKQAKGLYEELKVDFGESLTEIILEPSQTIGKFEVFIEKELVFSKIKSDRFPQPGEVGKIIMTRIYK
jgi:selT/selW/selH-like putative selenoprotein